MTTFIRLREPTKIQYHLKLHPDLICSFQVKGNFLIQKIHQRSKSNVLKYFQDSP